MPAAERREDLASRWPPEQRWALARLALALLQVFGAVLGAALLFQQEPTATMLGSWS
jgi:hypothetical protein